MDNPFAMRSWSPYVVGTGIGVLSWFAFATADKHLAITLQYEHLAALAGTFVLPDVERSNPYYAVREQMGLAPKVGWYVMLAVGVFFGSWLSSRLSKHRSRTVVPPIWRWRFGDSAGKRLVFAFMGGVTMVFGARLAGGCTSGHGISGDLQLAVSSWVFMSLAFLIAVAAAFVLYGKEARDHV
jgi:uncharacterized protein